MRVDLYRRAGRGFFSYAPVFLSRRGLLLLRSGRTSAWYALASVGVVAAAVVVVSVLTWLPNSAYEPVTHPIEQVIERVVPGGALLRQAETVAQVVPGEVVRQADGGVASLLGVHDRTVRAAREAVSEGVSAGRGGSAATEEGPRPAGMATTTGVAEKPSSPINDPLPPATPEPSPPPSTASEPSPPAAAEEERPPPAAAEEELPPAAAEEEPPPATEEGPPPAAEEEGPPPPTVDEPQYPPTGGELRTDEPPATEPPSSEPPTSAPPPIIWPLSPPTINQPPTIEPPVISEPPSEDRLVNSGNDSP